MFDDLDVDDIFSIEGYHGVAVKTGVCGYLWLTGINRYIKESVTGTLPQVTCLGTIFDLKTAVWGY